MSLEVEPLSGAGAKLSRARRDSGLVLNKDGSLKSNQHNAAKVISGEVSLPLNAASKESEWIGVLGFNEFSQEVVYRKLPPLRQIELCYPAEGPWPVEFTLWTVEHLQALGLQVSPRQVTDAIESTARRHQTNPPKEWLDSLKWDGFERIDSWLQQYLGAVNNDLHKAYGRKFLIAAVARIYQPGCKVDTIPVLEGPQGAGKSSALRALFGNEYFSDDFPDIRSEEASRAVRGKWCFELSELDSLSKAEASRQKSFASRQFDRPRRLYTESHPDMPRRCVFVATTNSDSYLKDVTGARRFWPVKVGKIDLENLTKDRDQLWAEAVHAFKERENWWLDTTELVQASALATDERQEADAWEDRIAPLLGTRSSISVLEVIQALDLPPAQQGDREQQRIGKALKRLGWERRQSSAGGRRSWRYFPSPLQDGSPPAPGGDGT